MPDKPPISPLGLPTTITACLFDLDGVITRTATIHAAAWKLTFDSVLRGLTIRSGTDFQPFDQKADYLRYVDGKIRSDGVRSFLAARGIRLPEGDPADPPEAETVHGIGSRKNRRVLELIAKTGVDVYPGTREYVAACAAAGLARAVVSASANTKAVLRSTGLDSEFDAVVDGVVAMEKGLKGKPEPDTFLLAANLLGRRPPEAAVFEDAIAGVQAGRAGGFGYVVGVNRAGQTEALQAAGADRVVDDLSELLEQP